MAGMNKDAQERTDGGSGLRLVLASQSPARLKLLREAGFAPEAVVSGVDESAFDAATPYELALILAHAKAEAVAKRVGPGALVIGCDSVLDLGGIAYGKPTDAQDAISRWHDMRGKDGMLLTGHCLIDTRDVDTRNINIGNINTGDIDTRDVDNGGPAGEAGNVVDGVDGENGERAADGTGDANVRRTPHFEVGATLVRFADLSDAEIEAYVATGEPLHVAGAFTLDGLGGSFVESIAGDPSNVIGLSLPLLRRLLAEVGVGVSDLWVRDEPLVRVTG
jgi:septum formation protein